MHCNIIVFSSKDDMFSIYSALGLGQDTVLISNDRFTDIAADLKVETPVCGLFNTWAMNQVVGYVLPFRVSVSCFTTMLFLITNIF